MSETTPAVVAPSVKLGKLPPKHDRRTLWFPDYIQTRRRPKVPRTHNRSRKTLKAFPDLGMMGNVEYSDCTFAGLGHAEQLWSVYGGKPRRPTDEEIISTYLHFTGGIDEGAAMLDVLKFMRREGIAGNKIDGFAALNPTDHDEMRTGHYLFGGLYIGANLPIAIQSQSVWDVGDGSEFAPGSLGGHAMWEYDYNLKGPVYCTWGKLQQATWAWSDRYVDEAYAVLEQDYLGDDNRSPQGFSLEKLAADLKGLS